VGGIDYRSVVKTTTGEGPGSNELNPWVDYGQTKWGDIALAKQLDKTHGPGAGGDIISVSVHPGEFTTRETMLTSRYGSYKPGVSLLDHGSSIEMGSMAGRKSPLAFCPR
jgi:NAD(P)-dependent dehydrogenase (short-subunit alcohol dehydrogenase family)